MIYAFDFDGTLCEDKYPEIGPAKVQAIEAAKRIRAEGNVIILWTCRVGERLAEAVSFCRAHGLEFDYINENAADNIAKYGNDCRKVYAHCYVDDRAYRIEDYINTEKIHRIALKYDYEPQSRQLIEECAELIQAINKDWRLNQKADDSVSSVMIDELNESYNHVLEELADVSIMISQVAYLRGMEIDGELYAEITRKLDRQIKRVEKDEKP